MWRQALWDYIWAYQRAFVAVPTRIQRSSSKPSACADGFVVFSNLDRPPAPKAWRLELAVRR